MMIKKFAKKNILTTRLCLVLFYTFMPRKNIHPQMYNVDIVLPKSDTHSEIPDVIPVRSTVNSNIISEVRLEEHPAWKKNSAFIDKTNKNAQKFMKKMNFLED